MLFGLDTRGQAFDVIALQHGHRCLGDDRPSVHSSINKVDRASAFTCPSSEGIPMRMSAWKGREQ